MKTNVALYSVPFVYAPFSSLLPDATSIRFTGDALAKSTPLVPLKIVLGGARFMMDLDLFFW